MKTVVFLSMFITVNLFAAGGLLWRCNDGGRPALVKCDGQPELSARINEALAEVTPEVKPERSAVETAPEADREKLDEANRKLDSLLGNVDGSDNK